MISKEGFEQMIRDMDEDNSGTVTKDEYKKVYVQMNPATSTKMFEEHWKQIDLDGSDTLEVNELAEWYGFNWDGESANEMTDEQILKALELGAQLDAQKDAEKKKKDEEKRLEEKKNKPLRDKTVIDITNKKNKDAPGLSDMAALNSACELSELDGNKDKDDVKHLVEKGIPVRFCDEKGEMPLHKLARYKVTDESRLLYKQVVSDLIKLMRTQCEKEKRPLVSDINFQDKQGRSPLFFAAEKGNVTLIDMLFRLDKEGPDPLLVNNHGQTAVHMATFSEQVESLEHIFKHVSGQRKKMLMATKDKTGRTPLHVASLRDSSEEGALCSFLIKHGGKDDTKDAAGNIPSELAGRSGRRNSKEVQDCILNMTGGADKKESTGRERRRSRDSKESIGSVKSTSSDTAPAAAAEEPKKKESWFTAGVNMVEKATGVDINRDGTVGGTKPVATK